MTDPTDLHAIAQAEQEARDRAVLADEQAAVDLVWLMGDERGRRFVWALLSAAGVFRLSYAPGDQTATAFREGARNLGLELLARIHQHCHAAYSLMVDEARTNAGEAA